MFLPALRASLSAAQVDAKIFANDGKSISSLMERTVNLKKTDMIVLVADPAFSYEQALSLYWYLTLGSKFENVQVMPVRPLRGYPNDFMQSLSDQFMQTDIKNDVFDPEKNIQRATVFIVLPEARKYFELLYKPWFDSSAYQREEISSFLIYSNHHFSRGWSKVHEMFVW